MVRLMRHISEHGFMRYCIAMVFDQSPMEENEATIVLHEFNEICMAD